MADLPLRPTEIKPEEEKIDAEKEDKSIEAPTPEQASEQFSDKRGGGAGRPTKSITAVNAYQSELEQTYTQWSDDLARDLSKADDEEEREELISAALVALLIALQESGRKNITQSMMLALNGEPPTPEMLDALADEIRNNDQYLSSSLIPDIGAKLRKSLSDPDILAALALGAMAFRKAIGGILSTMAARVATYAGAWWSLFNSTIGRVADKKKQSVTWHLDPQAQHCDDCPRFSRTYSSYNEMLSWTSGKTPAHGVQCDGNCRCWLTVG